MYTTPTSTSSNTAALEIETLNGSSLYIQENSSSLTPGQAAGIGIGVTSAVLMLPSILA
ncbi:hypothetical protein K449DRAFT_438559 [Hypoxylon sp. EC38]|nr:hypothetical protein K449DRAFT_438559 [Hypoxylon sp. EC38]